MKENIIKKIKSRLPKTPGILGEKKLFQSVVLLPLVKLDENYHILFQKRHPDIRQGGEICFPGGAVDKEDENYEQTAIRETIEELGIKEEQIKIIGEMDSMVALMGALIRAYVGILDIKNLDDLKVNPAEVDEVFTIPLKDFLEKPFEEYKVHVQIQSSYKDKNGKEVILLPSKELGLPERYHGDWGFSSYPIYIYPTNFGPLWGITARFIREFIDYFDERELEELL